MVRVRFDELDSYYDDIKAVTCGRSTCSVIIFVAYEIDAISSAKILMQLLRKDNITYTLIPIFQPAQLSQLHNCITMDIKCVFLINCGATMNLTKLLKSDDGDFKVFVLDNSRPVHLSNIYSRDNIIIFDRINLTGDDEENEVEDDLPSDGSVLSVDSLPSNSDDDSLFSEIEGEDDLDVDLLSDDGDNGDKDLFNDNNILNNNADDDDDDDEDGDKEGGVEDIQYDAEYEQSDNGDDDNSDDDDDGEDEDDEDDDDGAGDRGNNSHHNRKKKKDESNNNNKENEMRDANRENTDNLHDDDNNSQNDDEDKDKGRDILMSAKRKYATLNEDDILTKEQQHQQQQQQQQMIENSIELNLDDDKDDEEDEENIQVAPRKRVRTIQNKKKLRQTKLRGYYNQGFYRSTPTSMVMMNLVSGRAGTDIPLNILWYSAVATYYLYEEGYINEDIYNQLCDRLKMILSDHIDMNDDNTTAADTYTIHTADNTTTTTTTTTNAESQVVLVPRAKTGTITEGREYRLTLYRHWSFYQSMLHSPYIMRKLKIWTFSGLVKFKELLVSVGLEIDQAEQFYSFLSPEIKYHVDYKLSLDTVKHEFGLYDPEMTCRSFYRHTAFKSLLSTSDIVHATSALLDISYVPSTLTHTTTSTSTSATTINNDSSGSSSRGSILIHTIFNEAIDCMGTSSDTVIQRGIQTAITLNTMMMKKVTAMIGNNDCITRVYRMYFTYVYRHELQLTSSSTLSQGTTTTTTSTPTSSAIMDDITGSSTSSYNIHEAFGNPRFLSKMGKLIIQFKNAQLKRQGGWIGNKLLPLLVLSELENSILIVGISPLSCFANSHDKMDDKHIDMLKKMSNFRLFFKLAADDMRIAINQDISFDSNACEVSKTDIIDFLGNIDYLFKKASI